MKIAIASDHGGLQAKQEIILALHKLGHIIRDFGTDSEESCDYPDFAKLVCELVASNGCAFGILICGTGIGMSMAANRNPKIRAGLCKDIQTAELTRQHNNANVLCLGARVTDLGNMIEIAKTFIATAFEGGRHQNRIDKF